MYMHIIVLVIAIALIESYAQYNIKLFQQYSKIFNYILGVFLYAIIAYLLFLSYDKSSMGMTQVLWSGTSIITIVLIGSYIFDEKILFNEWVGIFLILSGVLITQHK